MTVLDSTAMLAKLVAFDTTSRNSNLELMDFVRGHLAAHGIASELVPDETGRKANLFATIGPADRPGLILSGHTDVVPVDGQDWSTDPFTLTRKDGLLHGRGTCDMKGFVAVILALVPEIAALPLAAPVHLALSYDEEVGCIGVRRLIATLGARQATPFACVVGEPTEMKVVRAHKGKISLRAKVRGHECHSSLAPRGVNAIEYAAALIVKLNQIGARIAAEGPFDAEFDIPYTTVHTGVIGGGTALNIVPRDCWFDFEFRHLPAHDPHALLGELKHYAETELVPRMQAVERSTGIAWQDLSSFPGLATDEQAPVIALAKSASGRNASSKVAFGTEAGLFSAAGIPTVVCGPGSIDQAHKPNEFVAAEQIAQCERFVRRMIESACLRR
jgi:acetylornithine deacetylase